MRKAIPLFPLNTVLFPGGVLPLRIFEPRYLDMISECLKTGCGIGVVLIREGKETGEAAETHDIGTVTEISYWHKRSDGLLGITLRGEQRFRVLSKDIKPNHLIVAEVELLENMTEQPVTEEHQPMVDVLKQIVSQLDAPFSKLVTAYEDANWVSARLIELLPFDLEEKQKMLMMEDAHQRLKKITALLRQMEIF